MMTAVTKGFKDAKQKEYQHSEVLTDWFPSWMEAHVVHRSSVPWELVQKLPRFCFPDGYALISTASSDLRSSRVPARLQKVSLLAGGCSVVRLYAAVCGRKWSNVPRPDRRVVCVR